MLKVGRQRLPFLPFIAGDGMALPFRADAFDAVTISLFTLKVNCPDPSTRFVLPDNTIPIGA